MFSRRLLLALVVAGHGLAATRLTLSEAEQMALRAHPQLQAARFEEQAAFEAPRVVRARLYPQAFGNMTGAMAPDDNTRILAGGINNPSIFNRFGTGMGVSQLITDFGRTGHLEQSAQFRARSAGEATKASRADVLLRVNRAYYSALRAQAVLKVAEQTVNARNLVVDQTTTLAQNKLKSDLDVTFARVNLEEAKLLLSNALNDRRSAMVELANAIGRGDAEEYELVEESDPGPLPLDSGEALKEALEKRPELKEAEFGQQAAAETAKAERALMFPSVSAFASAGYAPFHTDKLQNHWGAGGFNIELPFLNGGLYRARRAEAEALQRAAGEAAREVANRIARDVRVAYLNSVNAYERLQLTATLLDQAEQSLRLAQARYDLGLSSIIELSQAQLNLTRAQIAQASARYEYQDRRVALEYAKGAL